MAILYHKLLPMSRDSLAILELPLDRARTLLQRAGLRIYVEDNQIVAVWFGVV